MNVSDLYSINYCAYIVEVRADIERAGPTVLNVACMHYLSSCIHFCVCINARGMLN